jgi:hypothetical protein
MPDRNLVRDAARRDYRSTAATPHADHTQAGINPSLSRQPDTGGGEPPGPDTSRRPAGHECLLCGLFATPRVRRSRSDDGARRWHRVGVTRRELEPLPGCRPSSPRRPSPSSWRARRARPAAGALGRNQFPCGAPVIDVVVRCRRLSASSGSGRPVCEQRGRLAVTTAGR